MAHAHLRRGIRLAKRAAERLVIKQRIVPEPVRSARLVSNAPLYFTSKVLDELAGAHQCDYANESRRPIFNAAHLVQQPFVIEVRRIDSGATAQRIYFDSRIVDEQISIHVRPVIEGLQQRILLKRSACFIRRGERDRNNFKIRRGLLELAQLACVRRRAVNLHAISNFLCTSINSPTPFRASANSDARWESSNADFSAVACNSTNCPAPVITTFISTSARESS